MDNTNKEITEILGKVLKELDNKLCENNNDRCEINIRYNLGGFAIEIKSDTSCR